MIKKLRIQNFKCFSNQELELNGLTVLAGTNGVGKSTVIQALLIMRQSVENESQPHKHILLNGPFLMNLGNCDEIINSVAKGSNICFEVKGDTCIKKFIYDAPQDSLSLICTGSDNSEGDTSKLSINSSNFYYLNAERLGPRNTQSIVDQSFINTGNQGEFTGQAISKMERQNLKLGKEDPRIFKTDGEVYYSIKKQIELWMDYIIPGVQLNVDSYPEINMVRTGLKRIYAQTDYLNPYNIGFGITYLLPIIVTCLLAPSNTMVIIENPEAHLHPQGQSRIGRFLAKVAASGVQVIVETHSDHVINGIRIAGANGTLPNNLLTVNFFSQEKKEPSPKVSFIKMEKFGEMTLWPDGFLDQEEQDLAELYRMKSTQKNDN